MPIIISSYTIYSVKHLIIYTIYGIGNKTDNLKERKENKYDVIAIHSQRN